MNGTAALVLVGHGSRKPEGNEAVRHLAGRLPGPVEVGFIELARPSMDEALDTALASGAAHVVAVPAVLLAASHAKNDLPLAVIRARLRHPGRSIHAARPIGVHPAMLGALAERLQAAAPSIEPERTAVLLVGRGSSDPDANADLHKIARLFAERRGLLGVDVAFVGVTTPCVEEGLRRLLLLRPRAIVVLPYLLYPGRILDRLAGVVEATHRLHPRVELALAEAVGSHPAVEAAILQRAQEAIEGTGGMSCDACKYRVRLDGFAHELGGVQALRKAAAHPTLPADAPPHAHQPPRRHVLVCVNRDCADRGALEVLTRLRSRLREAGREREIRTTRVMCLGRCGEGPALVVYPDGVWYRRVGPDDIDDIVNTHLFEDRPVGRLIDMVLG